MGKFFIGAKIFILAKLNNYQRSDERWFRRINDSYLKCSLLDSVMLFLTYIGEFSVPAILLYGFMLSESKAWCLYSIESVTAVSLLVIFLKIFVSRKSPVETLHKVNLIGFNNSKSKSFPSMCAALSFAVATVIIIYFNDYVSLLLLAIMISFSRIYTGICYPLDVISGAIIGIIVPIVMLFLL